MKDILQHFRKEEEPFIEKVNDWIFEVNDYYTPKLLGFLNPRERFIVASLVRQAGLEVYTYGAFENAERQRVIIAPDYFTPTTEDFQITVSAIQYPEKFATIEHRDVLGSMMALGVDRAQFGDIILDGSTIQVAYTKEMDEYIRFTWTEVGKTSIYLEEVEKAHYLSNQDEWQMALNIVSSLRLDVVVSSMLNISRTNAAKLIKGERVKVNWKKEPNVASELQSMDMISIRGYGRFKVFDIEGRTRKDKIRLNIGKLR